MSVGAAPHLLCHSWLLECSYILCNADRPGFPIQYASAGFADMFETYPAEFQQKKCGDLIGIERIRKSDSAFESCMRACRLSTEEVRRALDVLHDRSVSAVQQMSLAGTGSFVTLNRTLSGTLLVVSVVMHMLRHPSGLGYALGLQLDCSSSITIETLFNAALHGELAASEMSDQFLVKCADMLSRDDVIIHLHRTVEDIWSADTANASPLGSAEGSQLSRRRRLTRLSLLKADVGGSSQGSYVQKLLSDGYVVGQFIARSRHNRSAKVIQAQKGTEAFAVKCVPEGDGEYLSQMLSEEYQLLHKLAHPNIVKVIGFVIAGDGSAMVMELIPGKRLCQSLSLLSRAQCHEVLAKVLGVLVYLHDQRIAHRDLKAENVMVDPRIDQSDDSVLVKLIDFGSACRETSGSIAVSKASSSKASITSFHENIDGKIMPPAHANGRGDSFELDVFATGLIIAGLLAKQEIFTNDAFTGRNLKLTFSQLTHSTERYVCAFLSTDPTQRHRMDAALRGLPPPECWYTDDQQAASEEARASAVTSMTSAVRFFDMMQACVKCIRRWCCMSFRA
mmetsp:Transcript_74771/g.136614  ORF Transcript_74771/g.136614 Transcript_74771/m.136614 type:complete len:564 (-) Transcript_74771:174-1865(-)